MIQHKMKFHKYLLISTILCLNINLRAESYNYESEIGYESYKSNDQTRKISSKIGIKYFPTELIFDNASPFTELAFIQRKSSYSFSMAKMQFQDSNFLQTQVPIIGFGIRANDADILLEINYNQSDKNYPLKTDQTQYYDVKSKSYEINYGWYVLEKTLLGLSAGKKIVSYNPGPGLTTINDSQRSSNGLILHSIIDLFRDQKLVVDLAFKLEKSQLQNQSTPENQTKVIKVKYFPVPDFYFLGGGAKSVGDDNLYVGNSKNFGIGYAPRSNLNFLISREMFTINNSNLGASHRNTFVSVNYKF